MGRETEKRTDMGVREGPLRDRDKITEGPGRERKGGGVDCSDIVQQNHYCGPNGDHLIGTIIIQFWSNTPEQRQGRG